MVAAGAVAVVLPTACCRHAIAQDEAGGVIAGPGPGEGGSLEGGGSESVETPSNLVAERPQVRWKRIMATQRVGGRLTSIEVDQSNPNRIFVGTEEGTILRSLDGGVTWIEFDITPFVRVRRTVGVLPPPKPSTARSAGGYFSMFIDPPNSRYLDRLAIPFDSEFFSLRPAFVKAGFFPKAPEYPATFLFDASESRMDRTNPVGRIQICPGGEFPLMATTKQELYGSKDDGVTFLRLYAVVSPAVIYQVACSPYNPNDVTVATFFGGFRSTDGGWSFDHLTLGRGEARVTAAHYAKPLPGDKSRLMVSAYDFNYQGDPDKLGNRLEFMYPDWKNSDTAPWLGVWWHATTDNGKVFLATDDGVRVSHNEGVDWETTGRALFSDVQINQVEVGANEEGGDRVAALSRGFVYATDDYGENWYPFFIKEDRRRTMQMAAAPAVPGVPPRWWVVTAGGLYASVPHKPPPGSYVDEAAARWALKELRMTPSLRVVLQESLKNTRLSASEMNRTFQKLRTRNYLPRIDAEFALWRDTTMERATQIGTDTVDWVLANRQTNFSFFMQGIWEIRNVASALEEFNVVRGAMAKLRFFEAYIVEDAYRERGEVLRQIAEGMDDPLQVAILKERVSTLNAVLEVWLGRSLRKLYFEIHKGAKG